MQRLLSARSLIVATLAVGGLAAASAANARTDVFLSLGLPGIVAPAPVYVQPQPVYVAPPQPVYVQPQPVYVEPQPVYVQPEPVFIEGHRHHRHRGWGDADHDGVPNRFDRAPFNPYRR
jgi:hypothetical protein